MAKKWIQKGYLIDLNGSSKIEFKPIFWKDIKL
jgi:hypothetical protein